MGYLIQQSTTAYELLFLMVDSTDHVTGKTGLSPTVTIRKAGGSFASPAGAVSEIANGWYKVAGNATDSGTLGPLVLHATGTAADPVDDRYEVVAFSPQDAVRLGLTALPNAAADGVGGLPVSDAGGLDLDAKLANTHEITAARMGALTDWIDAGRLDAILDTIAGDVVNLDGAAMRGTDSAALASVCTEGRLAELDAANLPTDIATIAGYIDTEVAAILAAVDTEVAAIKTVTDALPDSGALTSIAQASALTTLAGKFAGITSLAQWLGLLAGKQTPDANALTEIRATGAGSGTFDAVADSLEGGKDAIITQGNSAWATATGFSTLDAAGVRTAVGLAAANVDDQLAALPTASENAAALLAAGDVDGYTLEETLKLCLAALAGKLSGAATTTITIRAADDSKARITATVDADGNRSAVTLDETG